MCGHHDSLLPPPCSRSSSPPCLGDDQQHCWHRPAAVRRATARPIIATSQRSHGTTHSETHALLLRVVRGVVGAGIGGGRILPLGVCLVRLNNARPPGALLVHYRLHVVCSIYEVVLVVCVCDSCEEDDHHKRRAILNTSTVATVSSSSLSVDFSAAASLPTASSHLSFRSN